MKIDFGGAVDYFFAKKGSLVRVSVGGKKIFVRKSTPDLIVAVTCLHDGEFEILRFLLPSDYDGVIVDAGGYIGTAAIALTEIFPNAKIKTIEPSLANIQVLKRNVVDFENIEVLFGALVGKKSSNMIVKDLGSGEWGFTTANNTKNMSTGNFLNECPGYRLIDLVDNTSEIGILKLDIEGGELEVFEKDGDSLLDIGVIFVELHDHIVQGCSDYFMKFSENRIIVKDKGEKYLSIRR